MKIKSDKSYNDNVYAYELEDNGEIHYGLYDIKEKRIIGLEDERYVKAIEKHFNS